MLRAIAAAAIAVLLAPLATASAQDWPTRAVTMVVPYAAGGPVDTLGRILAARLSDILGQQVVVENVAGAGGMTGSSRVAKAPPDGYTVLLSGSAVLAINQTLYKKPLYNAVTDFEHVALFSDSARVLITRKDLPVNTLSEFVAYAKANQGKMQYGSAGAGSGMHVCAVLLDAAMGTKITHVPYRGSAPAMQDLMGGRIDFVRAAADSRRHGQSDRHARARARARSRTARHRTGAGPCRPRLRQLGLALLPQGNAGRDRAAPRQGHQRGGGNAGPARAVQEHRRDHPGVRAPDAGISDEVRRQRDRALGRPHQGERRQRRLSSQPTHDSKQCDCNPHRHLTRGGEAR